MVYIMFIMILLLFQRILPDFLLLKPVMMAFDKGEMIFLHEVNRVFGQFTRREGFIMFKRRWVLVVDMFRRVQKLRNIANLLLVLGGLINVLIIVTVMVRILIVGVWVMTIIWTHVNRVIWLIHTGPILCALILARLLVVLVILALYCVFLTVIVIALRVLLLSYYLRLLFAGQRMPSSHSFSTLILGCLIYWLCDMDVYIAYFLLDFIVTIMAMMLRFWMIATGLMVLLLDFISTIRQGFRHFIKFAWG